MPKVSVLSPSYNHQKYVAQAVQSVLEQSFADFELIVSDDASADGTIDAVRKFNDERITVLENKDRAGAAGNTIRALQRSQGKYVCFLPTDDLYEPNAVETLVTYLDSHPEAIAVCGLARYIDEDGNLTGETWSNAEVGLNRFQLLNRLFYGVQPFCGSCQMVRREALESGRYFHPHMKQIDDSAGLINLLFSGEMPLLPEYLARFRRRANHGNSSAPTPENMVRYQFEMFHLLRAFKDNIKDAETFLKIFPEAADLPWVLEDGLVPFFLAHVALKNDWPPHALFGLSLLHDLLSNGDYALYLKQKCGFGYPELFQLTGGKLVFMDLETRAQLHSFQQEIASLRARNEELERAKQEILVSLSWRITEPLRQIRSVLTPTN